MNKLIDNKSIDSMRRIINCAVIFSLFLVILFTCPVGAATYYVKNGGNDSLSGLSDSNAWATIAKVRATVRSGDTVYFDRQGSWSGAAVVLSTTPGVTYDGTTYSTGGTRARAKLIATAQGGARDAVVAINGTSTITTVLKGFEVDCNDIGVTGLGIGFNSSSASNILIDNCVIHNTLNTGWYYGMVVSYANSVVSNVTVQNCEGYDTAQEIFCVYNADGGSASNILFRNNILHDGGTSTTVGGYNIGFEIKNNTNGVTMEYNTIYNCEWGIHLHADAYGTPTNTVIRYNLIYNCRDVGITWQNTRGGNMTTNVYGNLFYGNASSGAYQDLRLPGNSNINIYNNTIYNANTLTTGSVYIAAGGGTVNFKNNIVYTTNSPGVYDSGGYLTHSNNLIYRASGNAVTDNGSSYTSAQIKNWDNTAVGTNPSFTGGTLPTGFSGTYGSNMVPNTTYFALGSASPAVNAGATLGSPYNGCINGAGLATPITRPQGAAYDIGAYEYAESGGVVPPPVVTPPVVTPPVVTPPAAPKNLRVIE